MVFHMPCACSAIMMTKIVRSPHSALRLLRPLNDCFNAEYAWKKCLRIQSRALILADIPSVANVYADM
jgi:hypothetical protein